jgi:TonB C terminal
MKRPSARAALVLAGVLFLAGTLWAGKPQMKVYFAADFKDQAYADKVYRKVAAAWRRPAKLPPENSKAVVITAILRSGKAPRQVLHRQSGVTEWDQAALAAVRAAVPFDPLPKSYRGSSVEVHFHFEYLP